MVPCPSCATEVPDESRFCLSCGAAVATVAIAAASSHSSNSSVDEGRFPAGVVLAQRYRILGLLGRGGMGEVYRANDTKLGQVVALKFLSAAAAGNPSMMERLHGEVRVARQVSHPNVCRVYDIGEHAGSPFLTMEYVDGEDLGSLLRRIRRLPADKALEIARKLCAGMAAAHDKGILHRDLKPANIMIDGRGQVLITDFGLAALAGHIQEGDRSGTPAYMAPEQAAGREVTVRSDIYSLGLVFHEMFTGKMPGSRTSFTKDLDPVIDRVIERCLASDPKLRPSSAFAVAAALPGGDPLAAALAAGETPSPEMVAAAGETEGMPVRTALAWLAVALVSLVVCVVVGAQYDFINLIPFESSPEALAHRSRELIRSFGYTGPVADSAWALSQNSAYQDWARKHLKPDQVKHSVTLGQPSLITFEYRQGPQYLDPYNANGKVMSKDPPPIVPGMCEVLLDTQGRLTDFAAVPPREEATPPATIAPADWKPLFAAAGLNDAQFAAAQPKTLPRGAFDARAAWTGVLPSTPEIPIRVEAASWRGRPTEFHLITPWIRPISSDSSDAPPASLWVVVGLFLLVTSTACLLAWRNLRLGRSDRNGAARIACFSAVLTFVSWLFDTHFVPTYFQYSRFTWAVSAALWGAGIGWSLYVALEPYVRRRWPQSLISWSRLLSGGFGDPLVGAGLLQGMALGAAFSIISIARSAILMHYGHYVTGNIYSLTDLRSGVARILFDVLTDVLIGMGFLFLFFLVRLLVRRQWIAVGVFAGLIIALVTVGSNHPLAELLTNSLLAATMVFALVRFGLLVLVFFYIGADLIANAYPTLALSAWYSGRTIVFSVLFIALSLYGFRTALAGRPIFSEKFLE